jgi:formylglycine-generating enzyme required for sulfatase activity
MRTNPLDSKVHLIGAVLVVVLLFLTHVLLPRKVGAVMPGGQGPERPSPTPTPKPTSGKNLDKAFWERIKNSTDPKDYLAYLRKYRNGQFADIARSRINNLKAAAAAKKALSQTSQPISDAVSRPANVTNHFGIELVWIPAGEFMMGSGNRGADEKPVHRVTISKGFYMGKYEVTLAQWHAVMGHNPPGSKGANLPVGGVLWSEAQHFISKLNEMNDGFKYRLPTEAEWEYACRAGTTGDYAGDLDSMAWYGSNSGNDVHPVGTKRPNAFGLYDMYGNVWEWCQDWYDANYYGSSPSFDPQGPSSGQERVLRGGSFFGEGEEEDLRSAARFKLEPEVPRGDVVFGFRVVASLEADNARRAAEKLFDDWFAALDRGDFEAFVRICDAPFLLIDKVLSRTEDMREELKKVFAERKPGSKAWDQDPVRSKKAVPITEFSDKDLQLTGIPEVNAGLVQVNHRNLNDLRLSHDDFVVIITLQRGHPAVILLYTRKVGSEIKLAGYWKD